MDMNDAAKDLQKKAQDSKIDDQAEAMAKAKMQEMREQYQGKEQAQTDQM